MNHRIQERRTLQGDVYYTKGNRPSRRKREADRIRGRSFYPDGRIPDQQVTRLIDLYPDGLLLTVRHEINDGNGEYIQPQSRAYGAAAPSREATEEKTSSTELVTE